FVVWQYRREFEGLESSLNFISDVSHLGGDRHRFFKNPATSSLEFKTDFLLKSQTKRSIFL
ncbi:MAG: hypothetical protein JW870_15615, partial [Candidatus Delongbacteria bacterium]|nr:hypothetical protein [Candidatus Delongbacteria bacterium]